jgi:hypothetical protein
MITLSLIFEIIDSVPLGERGFDIGLELVSFVRKAFEEVLFVRGDLIDIDSALDTVAVSNPSSPLIPIV